jgi:HAE1 family hydrophobic/amphiphilic exporter-1
VRTAFAQAPGLNFSPGASLAGASTDVVVEVRGLNSTSYAALSEQAKGVLEQVKTVPGLVDFNTSLTEGRPEVRFVVDRDKAAELGLSTAQIGSTVRTLVNGQVVTTYRGDEDEADIRVLLDDRREGSIEDILDLSLLTPAGRLVPLRQVVTVEEATGPGQIVRVDKQPTIRINANVAGRPVPVAVAEVTALVEGMELPDGMIVKMGGTTDMQIEGFRSLGLAMLLSIIFIYMVLASQFNSFIQPLLALLMTGNALDMTAFIGFIMLMGLVTKNSILLVDFANRERQRGLSAEEAMLRAGPIRLRPILMTSLSMILAMIPLVLGFSAGGEFRQGMSIAILGGLVTSTLLTLLIVPVAYALVVGWQDRRAARRAARQVSDLAPEASAATDSLATPSTPGD